MARNAIIQTFVDLFAAREVPGVFAFDEEEYTLQYEKRGDLDIYSIKILESNLPEYYKSLGIENISSKVSRQLLDRLIEPKLFGVMRLNPVKQGQTRREWIRQTLNRCIDTVFLAIAPVLPLWHEKDELNRASIELQEEYDELYSLGEALWHWEERKKELDAQQREVEHRFQRAMKESRENIDAVKSALFEHGESTFKQYVKKN